jgi:hypothetical protein
MLKFIIMVFCGAIFGALILIIKDRFSPNVIIISIFVSTAMLLPLVVMALVASQFPVLPLMAYYTALILSAKYSEGIIKKFLQKNAQ